MNPPDPVFTALSDPTRRAVFERVVAYGPRTATELATELPVSRQAVSKHLNALGAAGLVVRSRSGRTVSYTADLAPLNQLTEWAAEVGSVWDERLSRLKDMF